MTTTRYFLARFAQAFGYVRRSQRMADAAAEMHLLREAEAFLGSEIWEKVENIEELSVEYWNLRKLLKERQDARNRLEACQARLEKAHDERAELLNNMPESNTELVDERNSLLAELENLADKRDRIVAEARDVRRTYVGLKMKLEVLGEESADTPEKLAELKKVKTRLVELKTRFTELKEERVRVGEEIDAGDAKVDLVDEKIREIRQNRRVSASEAFQVIGEGNKEISVLRAETGVLDTRMRQLYAEIGRYVSRNAGKNPACSAAAASHQGLVDVMRALRRSIALNHRLTGNA
jgi:chromosome segregation ATPase